MRLVRMAIQVIGVYSECRDISTSYSATRRPCITYENMHENRNPYPVILLPAAPSTMEPLCCCVSLWVHPLRVHLDRVNPVPVSYAVVMGAWAFAGAAGSKVPVRDADGWNGLSSRSVDFGSVCGCDCGREGVASPPFDAGRLFSSFLELESVTAGVVAA